ncbi:hypothetical protein PR048_017368 [Dryococelus australis]|uniref:Uncharacterized protein n=1 Tax=Dryococelus australis TaxID=614101 RepID=A0ABQ9H9E1_9NEOP|nr:hypothetical protein PR048_017368 [Dryococelus australis]
MPQGLHYCETLPLITVVLLLRFTEFRSCIPSHQALSPFVQLVQHCPGPAPAHICLYIDTLLWNTPLTATAGIRSGESRRGEADIPGPCPDIVLAHKTFWPACIELRIPPVQALTGDVTCRHQRGLARVQGDTSAEGVGRRFLSRTYTDSERWGRNCLRRVNRHGTRALPVTHAAGCKMVELLSTGGPTGTCWVQQIPSGSNKNVLGPTGTCWVQYETYYLLRIYFCRELPLDKAACRWPVLALRWRGDIAGVVWEDESGERSSHFIANSLYQEGLENSPSTWANRVQFPAGSLADFRLWKSCWTASFLGDLPFSTPFHFCAAPYSSRFTLIGSQDLDVEPPKSLHSTDDGRSDVAIRVLTSRRDEPGPTPDGIVPRAWKCERAGQTSARGQLTLPWTSSLDLCVGQALASKSCLPACVCVMSQCRHAIGQLQSRGNSVNGRSVSEKRMNDYRPSCSRTFQASGDLAKISGRNCRAPSDTFDKPELKTAEHPLSRAEDCRAPNSGADSNAAEAAASGSAVHLNQGAVCFELCAARHGPSLTALRRRRREVFTLITLQLAVGRQNTPPVPSPHPSLNHTSPSLLLGRHAAQYSCHASRPKKENNDAVWRVWASHAHNTG